VDERTCNFRPDRCERAPDRAILRAVDKGGHVEKLWTSAGGGRAGPQRFEDPARQDRPARDESREKREPGGARIEQRARPVWRIDATGRDEIEPLAESRARAPDVFERRREDAGS